MAEFFREVNAHVQGEGDVFPYPEFRGGVGALLYLIWCWGDGDDSAFRWGREVKEGVDLSTDGAGKAEAGIREGEDYSAAGEDVGERGRVERGGGGGHPEFGYDLRKERVFALGYEVPFWLWGGLVVRGGGRGRWQRSSWDNELCEGELAVVC